MYISSRIGRQSIKSTPIQIGRAKTCPKITDTAAISSSHKTKKTLRDVPSRMIDGGNKRSTPSSLKHHAARLALSATPRSNKPGATRIGWGGLPAVIGITAPYKHRAIA